MKAYLEVNTSEELPEKNGVYITSKNIEMLFLNNKWHYLELYPVYKNNPLFNFWNWTVTTMPIWFLKPLPFEELMIGFAEWCTESYHIHEKGLWRGKERGGLNTTGYLLAIYCELKGIKLK